METTSRDMIITLSVFQPGQSSADNVPGWAFSYEDIFQWLVEDDRFKGIFTDITTVEDLEDVWKDKSEATAFMWRYFKTKVQDAKVQRQTEIYCVTFGDSDDRLVFGLGPLVCEAAYQFSGLDELYRSCPKLEEKMKRYEEILNRLGWSLDKYGGFQVFCEGRGGVTSIA
ncbi:hypothetical protein C8Q75DRAFT_864062 [Abortiporus biennis]|nr:hypothetical protein C8Q75DRAFT_864062 [Abortiporus biennis]